MDWSNDEVLLFLELYEREPGLWNPAYHNYKNRLKLAETWQRIADGLNGKFSISELKAKKMSLMATYRKLATKVRTGGDPHWRPEWFAFADMDRFLKDVYEPRPERYSNSQAEGACSGSSVEDEEPSREAPSIEEFAERLPSHFLEVTVDEATAPPPPLTQQPHSSFHGRSDPEEGETDECFLFGKFIAKKLRALDEETRELAMLEVHGLLYHFKRKRAYPASQMRLNIKSEDEVIQPSVQE